MRVFALGWVAAKLERASSAFFWVSSFGATSKARHASGSNNSPASIAWAVCEDCNGPTGSCPAAAAWAVGQCPVVSVLCVLGSLLVVPILVVGVSVLSSLLDFFYSFLFLLSRPRLFFF